MSEHKATIHWDGTGADFLSGKYSREHTWSFDGGGKVPTPEEEEHLHDLAHEQCFISNSIKSDVIVRGGGHEGGRRINLPIV